MKGGSKNNSNISKSSDQEQALKVKAKKRKSVTHGANYRYKSAEKRYTPKYNEERIKQLIINKYSKGDSEKLELTQFSHTIYTLSPELRSKLLAYHTDEHTKKEFDVFLKQFRCLITKNNERTGVLFNKLRTCTKTSKDQAQAKEGYQFLKLHSFRSNKLAMFHNNLDICINDYSPNKVLTEETFLAAANNSIAVISEALIDKFNKLRNTLSQKNSERTQKRQKITEPDQYDEDILSEVSASEINDGLISSDEPEIENQVDTYFSLMSKLNKKKEKITQLKKDAKENVVIKEILQERLKELAEKLDSATQRNAELEAQLQSARQALSFYQPTQPTSSTTPNPMTISNLLN